MAAEYVVQFTLLTGIISNDNRRVKGSRRQPENNFSEILSDPSLLGAVLIKIYVVIWKSPVEYLR
jgi:hypothetical protein